MSCLFFARFRHVKGRFPKLRTIVAQYRQDCDEDKAYRSLVLNSTWARSYLMRKNRKQLEALREHVSESKTARVDSIKVYMYSIKVYMFEYMSVCVCACAHLCAVDDNHFFLTEGCFLSFCPCFGTLCGTIYQWENLFPTQKVCKCVGQHFVNIPRGRFLYLPIVLATFLSLFAFVS